MCKSSIVTCIAVWQTMECGAIVERRPQISFTRRIGKGNILSRERHLDAAFVI